MYKRSAAAERSTNPPGMVGDLKNDRSHEIDH
jgi:hypothetical protein